jgi:hypothetical protein
MLVSGTTFNKIISAPHPIQRMTCSFFPMPHRAVVSLVLSSGSTKDDEDMWPYSHASAGKKPSSSHRVADALPGLKFAGGNRRLQQERSQGFHFRAQQRGIR